MGLIVSVDIIDNKLVAGKDLNLRLSGYETTSLYYSPFIHISTEVHITFVIAL